MRCDQHIGEFVKRAARRPPLRLGRGGILPPYIERGLAEVALFKSSVERILIDDARPADIDQQRARLHQGEPACIDQPCRFRRERAGDQNRVAQRRMRSRSASGKTVSPSRAPASDLAGQAHFIRVKKKGTGAMSGEGRVR